MSITDFLNARIAEDEAVANNARGLLGIENPWWTWENLKSRFNGLSRADTMHIARHDPARVLAECAAKRAILADRMRIDRSGNPDEWSMGYSDANYNTLRNLAAVYAEHPDYRDDEWQVGA